MVTLYPNLTLTVKSVDCSTMWKNLKCHVTHGEVDVGGKFCSSGISLQAKKYSNSLEYTPWWVLGGSIELIFNWWRWNSFQIFGWKFLTHFHKWLCFRAISSHARCHLWALAWYLQSSWLLFKSGMKSTCPLRCLSASFNSLPVT